MRTGCSSTRISRSTVRTGLSIQQFEQVVLLLEDWRRLCYNYNRLFYYQKIGGGCATIRTGCSTTKRLEEAALHLEQVDLLLEYWRRLGYNKNRLFYYQKMGGGWATIRTGCSTTRRWEGAVLQLEVAGLEKLALAYLVGT